MIRALICWLFHDEYWAFDKAKSSLSPKKVPQKEAYTCSKCGRSEVLEYESYD